MMKLRLGLLMILFLTLGVMACSDSSDTQNESKSSVESNAALSKVALEIPSIWCVTCKPRVGASAKSVPGVREVKFDNQTVAITYDLTQTTPDAIVEAIERRGDKVTKVTNL